MMTDEWDQVIHAVCVCMIRESVDLFGAIVVRPFISQHSLSHSSHTVGVCMIRGSVGRDITYHEK